MQLKIQEDVETKPKVLRQRYFSEYTPILSNGIPLFWDDKPLDHKRSPPPNSESIRDVLAVEPLNVSSAPTGTSLTTDYLTNSWNNICGRRELSTCQCTRPAHIGIILLSQACFVARSPDHMQIWPGAAPYPATTSCY